jgi:hypothetical protein
MYSRSAPADPSSRSPISPVLRAMASTLRPAR